MLRPLSVGMTLALSTQVNKWVPALAPNPDHPTPMYCSNGVFTRRVIFR